ncbi:MAG: hypothetical protein J6S53_02210 [Lentisphaeria bacterium]|nr:hypothetical protein [Lentisphaeria bacterium]
MRVSLLFLLVFSAIAPLFLSFAGEEKSVPRSFRELPENTSYTHAATALVFPPALASYRKTTVLENANPVYGTVIRYSGSFGESADIYVYSNDTGGTCIEEKSLKEEYEKIKCSLLKSPRVSAEKGAIPAKEEIKMLKEEKKSSSGKNDISDIYSFSFRYFLGGAPYESSLHLFLVKKQEKKSSSGRTFAKFVKIRLSRPSEVSSGAADANNFLKELMEKVILCPPAPVKRSVVK